MKLMDIISFNCLKNTNNSSVTQQPILRGSTARAPGLPRSTAAANQRRRLCQPEFVTFPHSAILSSAAEDRHLLSHAQEEYVSIMR